MLYIIIIITIIIIVIIHDCTILYPSYKGKHSNIPPPNSLHLKLTQGRLESAVADRLEELERLVDGIKTAVPHPRLPELPRSLKTP